MTMPVHTPCPDCELDRAVATQRLESVRQIGMTLRAGTNCGVCIPELEEILRDVRVPAK